MHDRARGDITRQDERAGPVLVVAGLASSLVNFRGALLARMVANGHRVHAAAPGLPSDRDAAAWLQEMGVTVHDIPIARTGLNPFADLRTFIALRRLIGRIRPAMVFSYTNKPVIWGMLAASAQAVPGRIALITGLGYAFTGEPRGVRRLVRWLARRLYAAALRRAQVVFFQNPDDVRLFHDLGLAQPGRRVVIVNGSGVDT